MASIIRASAFALVGLLSAGGAAIAQGTGNTSTGTSTAAPGLAPSAALPTGGVPAAGTVGGVGTPPADVQGKPGMSTPGANKP